MPLKRKPFSFLAFALNEAPSFASGLAGRRIAVKNQVLNFLREFVEGRIEVEAVGVGGQFERALENCRSRTRAEAAVKERAAEIVKNFRGIEIVL